MAHVLYRTPLGCNGMRQPHILGDDVAGIEVNNSCQIAVFLRGEPLQAAPRTQDKEVGPHDPYVFSQIHALG